MKRFFWAILLLAGVALAYFLQSLVSKYLLEPLILVLRIEGVFLQALPQGVWWGAFVLLLALSAALSLRSVHVPKSEEKAAFPQTESRVKRWSQVIDGISRGAYSRWLLANRLSEFAITMLSQQQRVSMMTARSMLINREVAMPEDVLAYFLAGMEAPSWGTRRFILWRLLLPRRPSPLDLHPEKVIAYLENHFEPGGSV